MFTKKLPLKKFKSMNWINLKHFVYIKETIHIKVNKNDY
jgi:hypothetical protein